MTYPAVTVEPKTVEGVSPEHPRILEGIRELLKKGYGNEQICKLIGAAATPAVVDRERNRLKHLKA